MIDTLAKVAVMVVYLEPHFFLISIIVNVKNYIMYA